MLAKVDALLNSLCIVKSGNIAKVIEIFGPGGMKVKWKHEPSEEDLAEFPKWLEAMLGYEIEAVDFYENTNGIEARKKAYQKFLDEDSKV